MRRISILVLLAGLAGGCKLFGDHSEETEEAIASLPSAPAPSSRGRTVEIKTREVEAFVLDGWLDPQNRGDVDAYLQVLAEDFQGTVLDTTGKPEKLDRKEWVNRRGKALKRGPVITLEELEVHDVKDPGSIQVTFKQIWETDTYCDRGEKKLVLKADGDSFLVTREEMETVEECPWASMASLLTFVDNYRSAVRKEQAEYVDAHTCVPFTDETRGLGPDEESEVEEIEDAGQVPMDLLEKMHPGPRPRKQKIGGVQWECVAQLGNDDATIQLDGQDGKEEHTFSFVFEEGVWKYCKHVHVRETPPPEPPPEEDPAGEPGSPSS